MRNSTFNWFKFFKSNCTILFFLLISTSASAQFYTTHYIAPAPWQYFSKANEIVIATNSTTTVKITVSKSDGTLVTNLSAVKGTPAVYRFAGLPKDAPAFALNTVLNAAGLIVKGDKPISINLRNIASDALGGDGSDKDIKGNAALTSFGDAGIGIRFRVGYYRDGSLGNFNNYGDQRPIYSVMAINNGTSIKINNVVTTTLNAGQSYLFTAPIGTLVESSNPVVMNTSAAIDTPGGCGDGAYNQIPPEAVLGTEYFLERGTGNNIAEQTTVVATKDDTKVTIESYSTTGALVGSPVTVTLAQAGNFYTFINGVKDVSFTASHIKADKRVAVYSGTAQKCEVDISTIAPVSECGGSNFIETAKFRNYGTGTLDYFGYILLRSGTEVVTVNGNNIANISGVGARYQIGNTGWYLINFNSQQIGSPDFLSIESNAKLTVSIVQQDGGFSMAGFFSNFAVQPEDPTFTYISGGGCTNNTATLKTPTGFAPYQWYLNGVAISGANSDTYTATKTGAYSVASTLTCGAQTQSKPVSVTLCTDLGVTKTVDNTTPCVGSNVEFTVKLSNLGVNNATGVSINDLLPTGYTFVSSTQTIGNYNASTGVWSIGDVNGGVTETLKITAKVNASGVYNNTAALPASTVDSNTANNSASVSTTPNPLPTASITGALTACLTTTLNAVTNAVSPTYVWYKNNVVISGQTSSSLVVNSDGDYKVKVRNSSTGCEATSAASTVKVSDTEKPVKPVLADITGQCSATATAPTTTDNCKGTVTGTTSDPLTYSTQGTYTINWSFNDGNGNVETATQKVIVKDTQKPTITCPSNVVVSANANSCAATGVNLGTPTTSDNCSGTVTVTNNAPSSFPLGNNTVTWTATDAAGNTQTCTQTVTVNDTQKPTITCPSNVVVSANANSCVATGVSLGTPTTSDNCSGAITVTNNAPSTFPLGNTTVTWTATDAAGNTQTCTQTVKVVGPIVPNKDTASINGYEGGTAVSNVLANDLLNCNAVVRNEVELTLASTLPSVLTFNTTSGEVTVKPNTPTGKYSFDYKICEVANTSNCNTATVEITVTAPVILAVKEDLGPINGTIGGTTTSLIGLDKLNGVQAVIGSNPGQVTLTAAAPTGFTINADGTITVSAGVKKGNYDIEYTICDNNNPATNCSTATSTVVVTAADLVANLDSVGSVIGGNISQTLINVFDNDTKNGSKLDPSDVKLTPGTDPKGFLTIDANGNAVLGANAPAGNYELTYEICELFNPSNCSTNKVQVTVTAPIIDAVAENLGSVNGSTGGTTTVSVIINDKLNGSQAVIGSNHGEVILSKVNLPTGFVLEPDGRVTVPAKTPIGIYEIEYNICEVTNTGNCDTAKSTVEVTGGVLAANPDTILSVVGINQPQTIVNVFDNDTNNALPLVPSDVKLSVEVADPKGFLTLNPDGTVTLGANAPRGTYELTYQICEVLNQSNCSSGKVEVTVEEPTITVTAESFCSNNVPYVTYKVVADNFTPTNLVTIKWIDSANNVVATQIEQPLSGTILWPGAVIDGNGNGVDWPGWLLANGQWTEGADGFENTRTGVTMQFSLNPTAAIPVSYPAATPQCNARPTFAIIANDDTAGPVDTSKGTNTGTNIFDNDKLNGLTVNPADVILSTTVPNANLTLNANGSVSVKAGTPSGTYQLTYQICDASNSNNCSQAVVKVVVLNSVSPVNPVQQLALTDDALVAVDGINGSLEFVNVLDNDKLNGQPINSVDVIIKNQSGNSNFEFNADGTVNVKPNTPGGTYAIVYQVCEKANDTNCSTATLNVFVEVPAIALVKTATFNDENNNTIANAGETISYRFTVTNTGNVPLSGITITDLLPGVVVSGQALDLNVGESNDTNFSALYKITQTDINSGKVSNQASVQGKSARGVVVEDNSDYENIDGDKPTVLDLNGCKIKVLNAFSPNGDQKNERFYIQGLECYPENTVEIYNRWGVLVFDVDHYNNVDRVFKGYSFGRTTMKQSEGLPVGTYFYILKYKDSDSNPHETSGYLYINK